MLLIPYFEKILILCKITDTPDQPTKNPHSHIERGDTPKSDSLFIPFVISKKPAINMLAFSLKFILYIILSTDDATQEKKHTKAQIFNIGRTDAVIAFGIAFSDGSVLNSV